MKQRLENVKRCQEALQNAVRLNSARLIQQGCSTQWNLCMPLLQPSLRIQVRKQLQHISECLDLIDRYIRSAKAKRICLKFHIYLCKSMEWLFRCRVHFELAKCDEEIEQLQTAEQHLIKAIGYDDERVHAEQLEHALKRLRLRAELYATPTRIEDQAAMILEQCVIDDGKSGGERKLKLAVSELLESLNSDSKSAANKQHGQINTHSLLLRAADLLAPNDFTNVLDSETYKVLYK